MGTLASYKALALKLNPCDCQHPDHFQNLAAHFCNFPDKITNHFLFFRLILSFSILKCPNIFKNPILANEEAVGTWGGSESHLVPTTLINFCESDSPSSIEHQNDMKQKNKTIACFFFQFLDLNKVIFLGCDSATCCEHNQLPN